MGWGRDKVRWERLLIFFGLTAALAILSSCGSSSTAVTPSITASCVANQGTGSDVTVLGTAQCTATVLNASSTLVNWSVSGSGNGSIDTNSGLYTAPAAVPTNNVVTITATSQSSASLTTTTSVTIEAATAITAIVCNDPSGNQASTVSSGNNLSCTAYSSVSTGATVPVNWTLANASNPNSTANIGTISAQGNYIAPPVPPPGQKVTITATSKSLATETMSVPISVVFGNKVLSGSYVFSTNGRLTNPSNAFWARVGSFTAGGGVLSGLEDTNQGGTPNVVTTQRAFTGSYSIGSDGRGTMQFCEGTSSPCSSGSVTANFNIVVVSPNQAEMIETPPAGTTTSTGEMISQDPSVFGALNGNLSGTYSFSFSGVSTTATIESAVGDFTANGFGSIGAGNVSPTTPAPGRMDVEAGGVTPSEVAMPATTYSFLSNGRGTVTLNGLTFSIYPVSASRAKFMEIDPVPPSTLASSILAGDAYKQQTSLTCGWNLNALNGATVFETSGMVTSGSSAGFAIGDIGTFTASNNTATGTISAASIDENSGGTVSSTLGSLSGSYTVDACGRGTLVIGAHTYVFYIITTSDAVLQETTAANGVVAYGFLSQAQAGESFVDASLTGSYAFTLTGTDAAGTPGKREDLLGQLTSAGTGTGLAGTVDLNDYGVTQTGIAIANGTYPPPAGGIRETMSLPLGTTPGSTRNLVLYMVSPTLFYALDVDTTGTAIGAIYNQF